MCSKPIMMTALSVSLILITTGKGAWAAGQSDEHGQHAKLRATHHARFGPTARPHLLSDARYAAPIGDRQPRQKDLPLAVRRAEGKISAAQREFDRRLWICEPC
jgi:hypothetical protein